MLDLLTAPQFLKRREIEAEQPKNRRVGNPKATWWSSDEVELLKRLYPNAPKSEVIHALPGRNWNAIKIKATKEGILRDMDARKAGYGERWTTSKLELLRKLYPNKSKKAILKAFPEHSWSSIQGVACRHNIVRVYKMTRMTKDQRSIILRINELGKFEIMRLLPDFDWVMIRKKAYDMGIEINILPAKDLEILWSMYLQGYSDAEIQTMVGAPPQTYGRALNYLKGFHNYKD